MKATITALKWPPSQPGRVWIWLDGKTRVAVSLAAAARFKVGDRIDENTVARLQAGQQRDDTYRCALRLLGRRDHSVHEIRQKLSRREFDPDAIDEALKRLAERNYLDDQAFAVKWVRYRINTAPRSIRLMRQELRQKGVDPRQIEAALADLDERELAAACLRRKRRRWHRLKGSARRLKMLAHLGRHGFSCDVSQAAVEACDDEAD